MTPAWTIIGVITACTAIGLLIVVLVKRIPFRFYLTHLVLYLTPFAVLVAISFAIWQYAGMESGWWILPLAGTIIEAVPALWCYQTVDREKQQELEAGKTVVARLLYYGLVVGITLIGAWAWQRGMILMSGTAPFAGFIAIWALLFIMALLVGFFTHLYVNRGLLPLTKLNAAEVYVLYEGPARAIAAQNNDHSHWRTKYRPPLYAIESPLQVIAASYRYLLALHSSNVVPEPDEWQIYLGLCPTSTPKRAREARKALQDRLIEEYLEMTGSSSGTDDGDGKKPVGSALVTYQFSGRAAGAKAGGDNV